jgi:hypothetical protein
MYRLKGKRCFEITQQTAAVDTQQSSWFKKHREKAMGKRQTLRKGWKS